jgi:hypothetical protein
MRPLQKDFINEVGYLGLLQGSSAEVLIRCIIRKVLVDAFG